MPKISVITSVYNTAVMYLQKYLQSLLSQTYRDFDVIIIDDASTSEETLNFLHKIENPNIRVIFQESNQGISSSRNRALQEATGEYVCVLDSDDYYQKDFLEKLMDVASSTEDVDMVICSGYTCVDEKGKFTERIPKIAKKNYFAFCQKPTGCRLFKRNLLVDYKIDFPVGKIYEDNVFCVAATLCAKKIVYVESYGYVNRQHTKSYSHGSLYKKIDESNIPYKYIKEKIFDIFDSVECDLTKKKAVLGEVFNILGTCSLIFCRESEKEIRSNIIRKNSKFIRNYISNYVRCVIVWAKYGQSGRVNKLLQIGYAIALAVHCEIFYTYLVQKLMRCVN